MIRLILSILVLITAVLNIGTEYLGPEWLRYASKVLAIFLILLVAVAAREPGPGRYKWLVVAALVISLVGDVLLVLPLDIFLFGLLVFLLAHLLYIAAFRSDPGGKGIVAWALLLFAALGVLIYLVLLPGLGSMTIPVLLYMLIIVAMTWQAAQRWSYKRDRAALFAAIGAALFMISDSMLAINRFGFEFSAAPAMVLTTYYLAQWLLARSVDQAPLFQSSGAKDLSADRADIHEAQV